MLLLLKMSVPSYFIFSLTSAITLLALLLSTRLIGSEITTLQSGSGVLIQSFKLWILAATLSEDEFVV